MAVRSNVSSGPGHFSWVSWIIASWVRELTVVVLVVQLSDDGLADSDEVLHVLKVRDVGVEVVLEVLEEVHVLLNIVVSPDSWEGERTVEEFPGVNSWRLDLQLPRNLHCVQVVLNVELRDIEI